MLLLLLSLRGSDNQVLFLSLPISLTHSLSLSLFLPRFSRDFLIISKFILLSKKKRKAENVWRRRHGQHVSVAVDIGGSSDAANVIKRAACFCLLLLLLFLIFSPLCLHVLSFQCEQRRVLTLLPLPAAACCCCCLCLRLCVLSFSCLCWVWPRLVGFLFIFLFVSVLELHTLFFGPGHWAAALSCLSLSFSFFCSLSLCSFSHSLADSLHYFVMSI